jgi:CheY-like chemotaxis protein
MCLFALQKNRSRSILLRPIKSTNLHGLRLNQSIFQQAAKQCIRTAESNPMKVLVAEDDPVSRKVLQFALEKMGHEAVLTSDGEDAWDTFNAAPVRIVVSDWMMPRMDGLKLCENIRTRPNTEYTYMILLTARTGKENYYEAMQCGVDDFLTKPLDQNDLLIRLRVAERILNFTSQIRQLKKLLPICMYCKQIRDDGDYWHQIESYIHTQTGSDFSHSVCPKCYDDKVKPQLEKLRKEVQEGRPAEDPQ